MDRTRRGARAPRRALGSRAARLHFTLRGARSMPRAIGALWIVWCGSGYALPQWQIISRLPVLIRCDREFVMDPIEVVAIYEALEEERRRKRKYWVHSLNTLRLEIGQFHTLHMQLRLNPHIAFEYYRMSIQ
ncbi:unnamed protein product [Leptosia nina]|uniref:Uncharacterized protein n=1 Tax=Leptosia nina TaxID=320188 RepID=A0AAV1JXW6_9NEOP